jgi:hypothetical protein
MSQFDEIVFRGVTLATFPCCLRELFNCYLLCHILTLILRVKQSPSEFSDQDVCITVARDIVSYVLATVG